MSKPIENYLDQLRRIEQTRLRLEAAFAGKVIKLTDVETVYEALFLRSVVGFESMIEDLFCQIAIKKIRYPRTRVKTKAKFSTHSAFYDIAWAGKEYLDWLPYNRTIQRAELYFENGRPFSDLDAGDRSRLTVIFTIRNVLAHRSKHSLAKFNTTVLGNQVLPAREMQPAGYLRSLYRQNPETTRFQDFAGHLASIAGKLESD